MTEQKRSLRFIQFLPGIAWFLFVLVLICLPGDDVPEGPDWFNIPEFDKIVHAGLFGGIVFLFCMPFKKNATPKPNKLNLFIKIAIATIVWGITTEYIQKFFIPGRQFDLVDWAADSAGAIIAFLVSRKFFL
ncbi:MAG: VanZ family protein [Bacteroidota bacterium]